MRVDRWCRDVIADLLRRAAAPLLRTGFPTVDDEAAVFL